MSGMTPEERALQIYCALLARDPLPQQRFQEIRLRFKLLAGLACAAADAFDEAYSGDTRKLAASWNAEAAPERKKTPGDQAREHALIANAREDEHKLPKSQADLIDQIGGAH